MSETSESTESRPDEAKSRSWPQAAWGEVREHPMAYFVMLCFVIAGPVVTHVLFPQAPPGAGLVGGVAFGVYAALCAMPGRFL